MPGCVYTHLCVCVSVRACVYVSITGFAIIPILAVVINIEETNRKKRRKRKKMTYDRDVKMVAKSFFLFFLCFKRRSIPLQTRVASRNELHQTCNQGGKRYKYSIFTRIAFLFFVKFTTNQIKENENAFHFKWK